MNERGQSDVVWTVIILIILLLVLCMMVNIPESNCADSVWEFIVFWGNYCGG